MPRASLLLVLYLLCAGAIDCGGHGTSAAPKEASPQETPIDIGSRAPSFMVRGVDGTDVVLVPDKVNVIFFWATWSEPDKKSLPLLQDMFKRLGPKGLVLAGLSIDDEPTGIRAMIDACGVRFPIVWDKDRQIATRYRPRCEPAYFVIDRGGVVRFVHCGYHDGEAAEIEKEVESLLGPRRSVGR